MKVFVWRIAVFACFIAVRVSALGADPPRWLSWSGGLNTDEGFYTLDARHEALFGTWARGNFHDRLLSPLLSLVQAGVFRIGGAGLIPSRTIDVAFGLLTICALWWGIRTTLGARAADASALMLGLMPTVVLYNRLALQETPTAFFLTLAFALWAWGREKASFGWYAVAGTMLGAAIMCKGLAIIGVPALLWGGARAGRSGRGVWAGAALSLALYGVFWYAPHHDELRRMGAYYGAHQFLPNGARGVVWNVRRAIVGDQMGWVRGLLPYMLAFAFVPLALAGSASRKMGLPEQVLGVWLASGIVFCALSSYAPDRYYMLFLPALAGLAGVGLAQFNPWAQGAWAGVFLLTSVGWLGAAWQGRTWTEREAGQGIARLLPNKSIVAGDMAPALCLNTTYFASPVQVGLSNDKFPVETLHADALAITRTPVYLKWWQARYPQIVRPQNKIAAFRVNGNWVDIYRTTP